MALATREIPYKDFEEYIEHYTGKVILSWRHCPHRIGSEVFFTDGTMMYVDHSVELNPNHIQYEPIPKSICVSCGEEVHASIFDRRGRCTKSASRFWNKVRKLYWHRHLKAR